MNTLKAQTVDTYITGGMCQMYMTERYGSSYTSFQTNPNAIMIEFVKGGVKVSDYFFNHFYPYTGVSKDGRLMYYDQSMINKGIVGILSDKNRKMITVVRAESDRWRYTEFHTKYGFFGKGKESFDRFWENQRKIRSGSN